MKKIIKKILAGTTPNLCKTCGGSGSTAKGTCGTCGGNGLG